MYPIFQTDENFNILLNLQHPNFMMNVYRLDDPTDAVAIHLIPGFWGAIAVPLFSFTGQLSYTPKPFITCRIYAQFKTVITCRIYAQFKSVEKLSCLKPLSYMQRCGQPLLFHIFLVRNFYSVVFFSFFSTDSDAKRCMRPIFKF